VQLSDGRSISAKHILIAVGGRPFVPEIAGAELAVTSNEMFDLEALPQHALIVGGGYIACEFACILHGLGVQVTIAYRGDSVLRGFDAEAQSHVSDAMQARGIDIRIHADVVSLARGANGIRAEMADSSAIDADLVLYATGRSPNTNGLGLAELGVGFGAAGQILVDDYSQTAVPSIFAVGDVTGRINLTPVAIREGHAFADTVFRGVITKADHDLVASAVFTVPELATVGMTEADAAQGCDIDVYVARFRPMKTLFAGRDDRMMMKLIVGADTQRVLGCHIVGEGAAEMIQLAAVALKMGATKADFDRTVAVHPTAAEELVTMRKPTRRVARTG
jgi:glutathione reductase (NADPH)